MSLSGEQLRDIGIALVMSHQGQDWRERARALVLEYLRHSGPCLMEDARAYAYQCGLPEPTSPNAWGGVVSGLAHSKLIRMTGAWLPSRAPRSHARMQPVWMLA